MGAHPHTRCERLGIRAFSRTFLSRGVVALCLSVTAVLSIYTTRARQRFVGRKYVQGVFFLSEA